MAEHVRTQIRKAVIEALQGRGTTEDRVFNSRSYPLSSEQLPGLCVYTLIEDSARDNSPTDSMRDLGLMVQGYAAQSENIEDELDGIALEVEKTLDELGLVEGLAKIYAGIQGTAITIVTEDTNKPHGAIAMEFLYTYRTRSGAPDVAI